MAGILQETGNAYPSRAPLLLIFSFFCVVFFICLCSVSCTECCQCISGLSIRDFPVGFL